MGNWNGGKPGPKSSRRPQPPPAPEPPKPEPPQIGPAHVHTGKVLCAQCGRRVGFVWLGMTVQFVEPRIVETAEGPGLVLHVCPKK